MMTQLTHKQSKPNPRSKTLLIFLLFALLALAVINGAWYYVRYQSNHSQEKLDDYIGGLKDGG